MFRILGTPTEESWPGVSQLPDYKSTFPQWSSTALEQHVPQLDEAGVDFLYVRALSSYFSVLRFLHFYKQGESWL